MASDISSKLGWQSSRVMAIATGLALLASCKGKSDGDDKPPIALVGTDAGARVATDEGPAPGRAPFAKPAISSTLTPAGWDIKIEVHATPGVDIPTGDVPYTAEPYNITRQPAIADVVESNVFETGLALDLDGDGKTTGGVTVTCTEDGHAIAGFTELAPLGDLRLDKVSYRDGAGAKRIGENGAHIVLYRPCEDNFVNVGLSPADRPIEVHTVAGPSLQIVLLERAKSPTTKPASSLANIVVDGKALAAAPYSTYVYEAIFEPGGGWATAQWVMLPLGTTAREHALSFAIATDQRDVERLIVTRIDVGSEPHVRSRSVASSKRLDEAPQ